MLTLAAAATSTATAESVAIPATVQLWYDDGSGLEQAADSLIVCQPKLTVSDDGPAMLEFTLRQPQHTLPIPDQAFVQWIDTAYGAGSTPLFEGHVAAIHPVASNELRYVCYDPTARAASEVFVLSAPDTYSGAVPRLLYNEKIDSSPDYQFQRRTDATISEIATDILDDSKTALQAIAAAPPGSEDAYVAADFASWDLKSQDRIEFVNATVRDAILQLLDLYPKYRLLFRVGSAHRQWRFYDATSSPTVTLTLNDFSDKKVLALDLQRHTERRYTAVQIDGPEGSTNETAQVSLGELTELWDGSAQTLLEAGGPASVAATVGARWQITDATKRKMARLLPEPIVVPTAGLQATAGGSGVVGLSQAYTRRPHLVATWDSGTTWEPIRGWDADWLTGVIRAPYPVVKKDGSVWVLPDDVKLYYAYVSAPLSVRYPTSGFSGTAYSVAGIETVRRIHDEMLAIGYERGTPVTSVARTAQFSKLAQNLQEASRDIVYTGAIVLLGHDYDFLRLNTRINIAAVDSAGDAVVTGWESVGAWITSVEYDFGTPGGTTTLIFSNDLEDNQQDIDTLKERLKIRPYETRILRGHSIIPVYDRRRKTNTLTLVNYERIVHFEVDDRPQQTVF